MLYNINIKKFEEMKPLLQKFKEISPIKNSLRDACQKNFINVSFLLEFSFLKIKRVIFKLEDKYQRGVQIKNCNWFENQLKLFHVTLILMSHQYSLAIKDFVSELIMQGSDEWTELEIYFKNKGKLLLQYEALNFIGQKTFLKKNWSQKQDSFLISLLKGRKGMECVNNMEWNQVSVDLFGKSEKQFFRTGKQCKQRWFNHLNEEIKHGQWSEQEDKMLVGRVKKNGKKWAFISKELKGKRTQHMIKNRYISLLQKVKKNKPDLTDEESALKELCSQLNIDIEIEMEEISHSQIKGQEIIKIENEDRSIPYYPSMYQRPLPCYPLYYYFDYFNPFQYFFPQNDF